MESNVVEELVSVKDEDIKRGHIYWSAIPFTEARPLGIFKTISGVHGKRVEEDAQTFKGRINNETGRRESEEIDVIIRHKRRMVTVVQSEESLGNFIYVLPITTYNGDNDKIEQIKNNPDVPQYHYIGQLTGKEAVVNISDMKRVHKSLLMDNVNVDKISDEDMEIIGKKLATLMDIEKLEKCEECINNRKNYLDKKEIESLEIDNVVNK